MQAAAQIIQQSQSEINHKAVINMRVNGSDLSATEIQQLQAIASQCEAEGGKAVNIARGLLASEGIMIWEDPGCPNGAKTDGLGEISGQVKNVIAAECWPNPTNGGIYVRFNNPGVKGVLSLYDAQGKVLRSQGFEFQGEAIEADVSNLAQGLVVVKVDLQDGSHFQWRVIVQR
jgi:stage V sporulation protein SpoVS